MDGDRKSTLVFRSSNHTYYDGKRHLPAVSAVIGQDEDKSGLLNWYAERAAECAIKETAHVDKLRRLEGDEPAKEYVQKAAYREMTSKGVAGSDLHSVVDLHLSGQQVPLYLDGDTRAMAEHIVTFLDDFKVEILQSEIRLANRTIGYAGTSDTLGKVPQSDATLPIIVDWKTSASMYDKPWYSHGKNGQQLGAYSRAEVMFFDDGSESDMVKVGDIGLIVMVRPRGFRVFDYDLSRAWPQFERSLARYHWWKGAGSLARGPIRPVGLLESLSAAAAEATKISQLNKLYQRALQYEVWSAEMAAEFAEHKGRIKGDPAANGQVTELATKRARAAR